MRRELTRKFLPDCYYQDNFVKFHNLQQKSLTMEEYTMEFKQLMMKCDVREKEEQTIARYLGGLDNDISKVVQLQQYWTLDDVIRLALRVKKQISKKNITIASKPRDFEASQGTQVSKIVAETPAKVEKEVSSSRPAQPNTRKCFKCQGFGHIGLDCPNRRIITIIGGEIHEVLDGEAKKEISDEIKPQLEEELIAADHGESLVVHRSPHDTITKDEDKALISRSTFQKLHQESRTAYLLLLSKVNDATSPFPEEIRSLLEEFSNVVPDETPHGLPQLRQPVGMGNLLYTLYADFSCFADLAVASPEDYHVEGQGSLLQCVLTPGDSYMPLSNDKIIERVAEQVLALFPSSQGLEVVWSSVVKIGQSLYREAPGKDPFRPVQNLENFLPRWIINKAGLHR
ncbi:hypothetical protein SLEP1_g36544 [Rubroshorea leprosula]|uniref:CCHC-type domain-containing protein n=1 Tax=Rubroshorea leprosula TaxID=152421 RepID=A0AAV5KRS8_9ROSI|nr:hypothetical protein SLEP1_g36544 [Rubroshorea leprosula]